MFNTKMFQLFFLPTLVLPASPGREFLRRVGEKVRRARLCTHSEVARPDQAIGTVAVQTEQEDIPDEFLCPISGARMVRV